MKRSLSPLAYLIDDELLNILLNKLDDEEHLILLKLGVDVIGLGRDIVYKAKKDLAVKDVILHLASVFKMDEQQRLKLLDASLIYVSAPKLESEFTSEPRVLLEPEFTDTQLDSENKQNSKSIASSLKRRGYSKAYKDGVKPNSQQESIINNCSKGLQVDAFAGTGKSTTSRMVVNELGHETCLYTAFLSKNIVDAKEKITPNAVSQDGLAVRHALKDSRFEDIFTYTPRGGAPVYSMRDVLGFETRLDIGTKKIRQHGVAKLINDTVYNYCSSSDNSFHEYFVPNHVLDPVVRSQIHNWAMKYWEYLMSGRATKEHSVSFSHLMKYWALTPSITIPDKYQSIIIDEAQDINGAFYRVMLNHADRRLIIIGDKYQELFRWRGAINSMDKFDKTSYPLEESYRFGTEIAECANNILSKHEFAPKNKLIGQQDIDSKVVFYEEGDLLPNHNGAILTRTRSCVINIADNELRYGNKIHVKTEFGPLEFLLKDMLHFAKGETDEVEHPYLLRCGSIHFLENELKDNPDADIYFAFKLYQKYKDNVLDVIGNIRKNSVPEDEAMKIISTTHSIKGQEWDYIIIAPDYAYTLDKKNIDISSELSVLYVALTRARKSVYVPASLKKYFI
ncbi:UvrD-helicase domain-containing protein [Vibrio renipiscarius]|uniref:Uncharacterized protein n=1 Tax=Vibrio renipiscarius TaxID=1461322 RepID=A0A0C2NSU0_9VIBR|nr:UvrD-helicase domain-containing protein [Vibrio renipiscarius]KII79255.1 hypothetical protein OJ16_08835 [Vibrio renipiscarius]KII81465.1 hypothetical protein PL18_02530 [Vibrio renipiscarius]